MIAKYQLPETKWSNLLTEAEAEDHDIMKVTVGAASSTYPEKPSMWMR